MRAIERLLSRIPGARPGGLLRGTSFLVTLLLFAAGGTLVFRIVLPELGGTITTLGQQIPAFFVRLQQEAKQLEDWIPNLRDYIAELQLDWKEIVERAMGFLQNGATSLLGSTMNIATSVFSGVFNTFMGFIFAVYILFGKEKLKVQARRVLYAWLPVERADRVVYVADLTEQTFSRFLTGQCLEAVILGLMFFVSMSLLKFPYAMLVAVLVAVTALIPMFGAFIGCFVGAFLILVVNPMQALWFVLLFLLLQQIEGNLIYPRVVGSSIGLPAMWVMVAGHRRRQHAGHPRHAADGPRHLGGLCAGAGEYRAPAAAPRRAGRPVCRTAGTIAQQNPAKAGFCRIPPLVLPPLSKIHPLSRAQIGNSYSRISIFCVV